MGTLERSFFLTIGVVALSVSALPGGIESLLTGNGLNVTDPAALLGPGKLRGISLGGTLDDTLSNLLPSSLNPLASLKATMVSFLPPSLRGKASESEGKASESEGKASESDDQTESIPVKRFGVRSDSVGNLNFASNGASITGSIIPGTIYYRGGPVLTGNIPVHYIMYGTFSSTARQMLKDYTENLGNSGWWNITVKSYATGRIIPGRVANVSASSTLLTNANVITIIRNAISSGALGAPDPKAAYLLLTSSTVNQCTDTARTACFCSYCGWHSYFTYNNVRLAYGWVGDPSTRCPRGCSMVSSTNAPNGNLGMDALINVLSHELTEIASDPFLNAWYDNNGAENADKCSWNVLNVSTGTPVNPLGIWSNQLGPRKFLIQNNWGRFPTEGCQQTA